MSRTKRKAPPKLARPVREDKRGNVEPSSVAVQREHDTWCDAVWAQAEREEKRKAILADCFTELSLQVAHLILKVRALGMTPQAAAPAVYESAQHAAEQFATLDEGICVRATTWAIVDKATALAETMSRNRMAN